MSFPRSVFLHNKRGASTTYAVCFGPAEFGVPGATLPSFICVWRSIWMPPQGRTAFMVGTLCYAWAGLAPMAPLPGVQITAGMRLPAELGTDTDPGSSFDLQIVKSFPVLTPALPPAGRDGAFEVWTGYDFEMPNDRYLVGLAELNHRGQIAPVAFVNPKNNTRIQVKRRMRLWIMESHEEDGTIVHYTPESGRGAVVDFDSEEARDKYVVDVSQMEDGTFSVVYS